MTRQGQQHKATPRPTCQPALLPQHLSHHWEVSCHNICNKTQNSALQGRPKGKSELQPLGARTSPESPSASPAWRGSEAFSFCCTPL